MGMMFPEDLAAWGRWQAGRHPVRRLRHAFDAPAAPAALVLHTRGGEPAVLFAVDATTPAAVASTTAPLAHLGDSPAAVLAPADVSALLPGDGWATMTVPPSGAVPRVAHGVRAVVTMGHFLPAGATAYAWSRALTARLFVVQHGLLAPQAPPLPHGAHVFAFTDRDGAFWASGRRDVTWDAVGSHLLWHAAHPAPVADTTEALRLASLAQGPTNTPVAERAAQPRAEAPTLLTPVAERGPQARDEAPHAHPPIFLGQLHGAELPRHTLATTAGRFCRANGALYRPHPAETDVLSRLQHAAWRRQGIRFAPDGPLLQSPNPVVSIFSTGVLEAAAAGRDAWVTCERPPAWLGEFWERYGLHRWGDSPTPPPPQPAEDPAHTIAERVLAAVEGAS